MLQGQEPKPNRCFNANIGHNRHPFQLYVQPIVMLVPVLLLPAILPQSRLAQKPASACPANHSRTRNSSLLGLTGRDFMPQI